MVRTFIWLAVISTIFREGQSPAVPEGGPSLSNVLDGCNAQQFFSLLCTELIAMNLTLTGTLESFIRLLDASLQLELSSKPNTRINWDVHSYAFKAEATIPP